MSPTSGYREVDVGPQRAIAHRSRARRTAARAARLADRLPGTRLVAGAAGTWYAQRSGAPSELIRYGRTADFTLAETIAFFRLVRPERQAAGGRVGFLINKVGGEGPDETLMKAILRLEGIDLAGLDLEVDREVICDRVAPLIEREIATFGRSATFRWMVTHHLYDVDDDRFRRVILDQTDRAFRRRRASETPQRDPADDAIRRSLIELIGEAAPSGSPYFLTGWTLLELVTSRAHGPSGTIEVGTFGELDDALLEPLRNSGFELLSVRPNVVELAHSGFEIALGRYEHRDDRDVHDDGVVERWHSPLEPAPTDLGGFLAHTPQDIERYLEERFGNWRTDGVLYDDVIDAPNTNPSDTLLGMLYVYWRTRGAFARSEPFVAGEMSATLRDRFNVDMAGFVPRPVHRKALFTPFEAQCPEDLPVVVAVGAFTELGADGVGALARLRSGREIHLVAAVSGRPPSDAHDRLMTVKTLRSVDHVMMWSTDDELVDVLDRTGATEVVIFDDAGIDVEQFTERCSSVESSPLVVEGPSA